MTSRVSFSKYFKETLKRHTTSTLVMILAFVIHFIVTFITLQNAIELYEEYEGLFRLHRIMNIFLPNFGAGILALGAGLFLAFDYFKFLHSKKETDFYESLPVTKQQIFFTNLLCAFGIFFVLSLITLSLEFIILMAYGYATFSILAGTICNFLVMNGLFLASFVTAVLAWVMTGNPIIGLLGYGAFSCYFPFLLLNLFPTFAMMYFDTYVRMPVYTSFNWNNIFYYMSPASLMYKILQKSENVWQLQNSIHYIVVLFVFILAIGFLAFKLYQNRPSETAGRAMAFEKVNDIIRILIVIPLSLYLGVLLKEITSHGNELWLIFGILFGGFVIHGLVEAIFDFDVKAAFRKKKQLLLSYLCCFLFVSLFWLDPFHYDQSLPNAEKVDAVYINMNGFLGYDYSANPDGLTGEYAKMAILALEDLANNQVFDQDDTYTYVNVEFHLKNGVRKFREYKLNYMDPPVMLNELSKTEAFKNDICLLYNYDIRTLSKLEYSNTSSEVELPLDKASQLFDAYKKDYLNLSLKDYFTQPIECQLIIESNASDEIYSEGNNNYSSDWLPVFSNFENTILLLKEMGYVSFQDDPDITIKYLQLYHPDRDEPLIIEDLSLLAQMKPYIFSSYHNYHLKDSEYVFGHILVDGVYSETNIDVYMSMEDLKLFPLL